MAGHLLLRLDDGDSVIVARGPGDMNLAQCLAASADFDAHDLLDQIEWDDTCPVLPGGWSYCS